MRFKDIIGDDNPPLTEQEIVEMKPFDEFFTLREQKQIADQPVAGLYVAVHFDDETLDRLFKYQVENKIPNPVDRDDLHTTIVYSREPIEWECEHNIDRTATPTGLDVFGEDKRILVLLIDSIYLEDRWKLADSRGATYDFDKYRPHVSLSYDIGDFDIDKLSVPNFDLTIDSEYSEDLDE